MNSKIYYGNTQPNSKEFKIWVNNEGVIKTYDATQGTWSEVKGGESAPQPAPAEKITFTVVDYDGTETTYDAERGMTWKQFGESQYNTDAWVITPEGFPEGRVYIYYIDRGGWSGGESCMLTYLPSNSGVEEGLVVNRVKVNDFILADHVYGRGYDSWGVGGGAGE